MIDLKKYLHKNNLKIALIAAVAIIILLVLYLVNNTVRINLEDELDLRVEPSQMSVHTQNGNTVQIRINITNRNFNQCRSRCQFQFIDLSSPKVISNSTSNLEHGQRLVLEYNLTAPARGSGQRLYQLEASCSNIKSVLCPTEELPRMQSSIVALNYDLGEEELASKEAIEPIFAQYADNLREAKGLVESLEQYAASLPPTFEKENITNTIGAIKLQVEGFEISLDTARESWAEEDYLSVKLPDYDLTMQIDRLKELQGPLVNLSTMHNSKVRTLVSLESLKPKVSSMLATYTAQANPVNDFRQRIIEVASGKIVNAYRTLKSQETYLESNISKELEDGSVQLASSYEEYAMASANQQYLVRLASKQLSPYNISIATNETCEYLREAIFAIDQINANANNTLLEESLANEALAVADLLDELTPNTTAHNIGSNHLSELEGYEGETYNPEAPINASRYQQHIQENCRQANFTSSQSTRNAQAFTRLDLNVSEHLINTSTKIELPNFTISLPSNEPSCCISGDCSSCCQGDCFVPTLFIHGHAFNKENTPEYSMRVFGKIQSMLQQDGFVNLGELDLRNLGSDDAGIWGRTNAPVTIRSTFYYITHYSVGGYEVTTQNSESIENYAIRLRELIDVVKKKTGSSKVNIVAHSMGGLVARQYIDLFGPQDISMLITINTPHRGIEGRTRQLCAVFGAQKECDDLASGSIFLRRLNSKPLPSSIQIYSIRSEGCATDGRNGDGVVTSESAYLEGAVNYVINGTCTDALGTNLHSNVLDPDQHPELYDILLEILKPSN